MVGASTFGAIQNGDGGFGKASAVASADIPIGAPTVALRAGAQRAFGNFPIHEAAMLGGRESLRGFGWNRFSGDAAVFGNAELRVPVVRMELLVRGTLGVIGLADAGRVWVEGDENKDWHTSYGGGLSFTSLGKAVSAVFAHGEQNRVYLNLGLPF
jgi:hemolysin activation/secretion protein